MAVGHIDFDEATPHGGDYHGAMRQFEGGFDRLNKIKATMALMIDGDGTQAAHFTYMTAQYGFTDNAAAKASWDELNSLLGKLNTDASVSSVNAAILQFLAKHR